MGSPIFEFPFTGNFVCSVIRDNFLVFLKFHQNKLRSKRSGGDIRCSKSLEPILSKQEISGWLKRPIVFQRGVEKNA